MQRSARTLAELRAGWLEALSLAQQTLVAGLVGELNDLPHAGAARLKSAELAEDLATCRRNDRTHRD